MLSILAGWIANLRQRAMIQREAVMRLTNREPMEIDGWHWAGSPNVSVYYDDQMNDRYLDQLRNGLLANAWQDRFGRDFLHQVRMVQFHEPATFDQLRELKKLPGLEVIGLYNGLQDQHDLQILCQLPDVKVLELNLDPQSREGDLIDHALLWESLQQIRRLRELTLNGDTFTSIEWQGVAKLKPLRILRLYRVTIQQQDWRSVPKMEQLECFYWSSVQGSIHDTEFEFVANFPNLQRLALNTKSTLSDRSINTIATLRRLEMLSLHSTRITGANLQQLTRLKNLRTLELNGSRLDDAGLRKLSQCTQLERLEIGGTDVTDVGMQYVAKLPNLRHLSLQNTSISDAGLAQLKSLKRMRFLEATGAAITPTGASDFQRSHPNCVINR